MALLCKHSYRTWTTIWGKICTHMDRTFLPACHPPFLSSLPRTTSNPTSATAIPSFALAIHPRPNPRLIGRYGIRVRQRVEGNGTPPPTSPTNALTKPNSSHFNPSTKLKHLRPQKYNAPPPPPPHLHVPSEEETHTSDARVLAKVPGD